MASFAERFRETHNKGLTGNNPFEIIRTRLNSSAHKSNQNHNRKISKAAPAMFKINRTTYNDSGSVKWGKGENSVTVITKTNG